MGNAMGRSRRRAAKIMKINGETTKVKTPIQAKEITEKQAAGHVLLDSEAVKHYGMRAKPLDPTDYLEPRRVYFLVELPKHEPGDDDPSRPHRVRSSGGIHMSAKDRLESLMLSRRSVSDLSAMKPISGSSRVRMRIPKADVERLIKLSKDEGEAAQRIIHLCSNNLPSPFPPNPKDRSPIPLGDGFINQKRVGFLPVTDDEIRLAVAS